MVKKGAPSSTIAPETIRILISQPKPESEKSPYFDLEKKHHLQLTFSPFIRIESLTPKEFRAQKINILEQTAVIFTSRNAIDQFFKLTEEMRISINQDTKYFCISEAVALYLQKFILYRKRKVFFGADGTNKGLFDIMNKYKAIEQMLYVCSENQQDNDIVNWLKTNKCEFRLGFMYRSVSCDITELFKKAKFDIICLFTPSGIKSLLENFPKFKQKEIVIGCFGNNTIKAAEDAGLIVGIKAPAPKNPSMVSAIETYILSLKK